jgi:HD superfamily phosphohydrolase
MQQEFADGMEFKSNAPHEILTLRILRTERFRSFFKDIVEKYGLKDCSLEEIETFIMGTTQPDFRYKADFINGPFDADKIDYLFRDGRFSGLPMVIDLDRLWYSTLVDTLNINGIAWNRLVIEDSGASSLEQILFNRVQLYPSMYHHQKVRACLCMFKGVVEHIQKSEGDGIQVGRRKDIKFNKVVDFLWGSDSDFWAMGTQRKPGDPVHDLVHGLQYRRLLKRAMMISRKTVEPNEGYDKLMECRHAKNVAAHQKLRDVAKHIWEEAKKAGIKCNPEEIWIDLPDPPKLKQEINMAYVRFPDGKNPLVPLNDAIFPLSGWLNQYELHMWRGHVFVPPGTENNIAKIVKGVMEEEFQLKIYPEAFTRCHL